MNAEQLGAGTPSGASDWESSEPGSPVSSQWDEALTDAQASADLPDQVLTDWSAEDGQGQHEDRQLAVSRMRAWRDTGDLNEPIDLSSLSLTTLAASIPAGSRRLNVDNNQLHSLPETLPASLQRLYANNNRLTGLPELPRGLRRLYAISNGLSSLPEALPPGLRRLNVDNNRLSSLPDCLPPTLQELDVAGNRLTRLPELPAGLERLNVDYNQLTDLPEPLPPGLEWLSAGHNRLTSLPETFPAGLLWLAASNNQLTNVPATVLTQLSWNASVDLENNPLSDAVQAGLATAMHAGDYAGPQVFFSNTVGAVQVEPRSLQEVVTHWLEGGPAATTAWQAFAEEPGALDYARFLDRLRGTVNYGSDAFRHAVAEDLRQAAIRPNLREQYFELASGASASCEDRVTLTWNGMQSARLNADVEDGAYDGRLGELLQHGRVMFRLEALDRIARETVNSLRRADPDADVDEIEVYLAYQTQLRDALELRHIAPDMRFMSVSHVTGDDVARAETAVRNEESTEFPQFLATRWQPWESVLRRIAPEDYAEMQERLVEAMGEPFQARLDRRLAEDGLTGDADAERVLGAQIRNEIAREIKGTVMDRVLGKLGFEL
ncbi:NEL-type E3 ubiquitin ligase domain-containing protein [Bradyrhizobium sp. USDA 4452]